MYVLYGVQSMSFNILQNSSSKKALNPEERMHVQYTDLQETGNPPIEASRIG